MRGHEFQITERSSVSLNFELNNAISKQTTENYACTLLGPHIQLVVVRFCFN